MDTKGIDVSSVLGEDGLLSERFDDFEFRPSQLAMAKNISDLLEASNIYLSEAETGIGKSFAYLVPAILSGKTVVISTGTKNLQDQLMSNDLPFLEDVIPRSFRYTALKGWSNYVCKRELYSNTKGQKDLNLDDLSKIKRWAKETETGVRKDSPVSPNSKAWSKATIPSIQCIGEECDYHDECFPLEARKEAARSNIIVVNHHLFLINSKLKKQFDVSILPEFDAVVFDEAHHLEKTSISCFSNEYGNKQHTDFKNMFARFYQENGLDMGNITGQLEEITNNTDKLLGKVSKDNTEENKVLLSRLVGDQITESELIDLCNRIKDTVSIAKEKAESHLKMDEKMALNLMSYCARIKSTMSQISKNTLKEGSNVSVYVDYSDENPKIVAAPVNADELFNRYVLENYSSTPFVFTSATLSADQDLSAFGDSIGIDNQVNNREIKGSLFKSSFNYQDQCKLFVPRYGIGSPSDKKFTSDCSKYIKDLIGKVNGGTLLLFTSYRNMDSVYSDLSSNLSCDIYKQGDDSKENLVEQFKSSTSPVLFGTKSFWEGVDIPGNDLELVVVDKIPFPNINDPIFKTKRQYLQKTDRNPFSEYSMPKAAISLRQGIGRLIRSKQDKGVIAILDKRIHTKRYGSYFLSSIPDMPSYSKIEDIENIE